MPAACAGRLVTVPEVVLVVDVDVEVDVGALVAVEVDVDELVLPAEVAPDVVPAGWDVEVGLAEVEVEELVEGAGAALELADPGAAVVAGARTSCCVTWTVEDFAVPSTFTTVCAMAAPAGTGREAETR